jgi:hypothetical protein
MFFGQICNTSTLNSKNRYTGTFDNLSYHRAIRNTELQCHLKRAVVESRTELSHCHHCIIIMIFLNVLLSSFILLNVSLAWVPHESTKPSETRLNGARIGFLGCGTIASAIAKGIATQTHVPITSIAVTKRSESKSSKLLNEFPSLVSIHDDNQGILDESDLLFLCVLPQLTNEILQGVSFDESRHNLISLVVSNRVRDIQLVLVHYKTKLTVVTNEFSIQESPPRNFLNSFALQNCHRRKYPNLFVYHPSVAT